MLVPNRFESVEDYKYGFQGQEKDDEIKGEGNSYDFGARMLDARVGRFISLDPLVRDFPFYSPFQFAGNSPIMAIDLDGLELQISNTVMTMKEGKGSSELTYATDIHIHYKILNLTGKKIEGINKITEWASERSKLIYSDKTGLGNFVISFDENGNNKTASNYRLIGNIKKFTSTYESVSSINEIKNDDYVIVLVDQRVKGAKHKFSKVSPPAYVNNLGGNIMVVDIGHPIFNAESKDGKYNFNLMVSVAQKIARTINHEKGHNLGLDDEYSDETGKINNGFEENVMANSDKRNLTNDQIAEILNDIFTNDRIDKYWTKKTGKTQTDETLTQLKSVLKKEGLE